MKLVIQLDDETYKEVMDRTEFDTLVLGIKLIEVVQNATLLPKEHGRLIDENEVKQMIKDAKVKNEASKNFAENIIRFAPTVIEADS